MCGIAGRVGGGPLAHGVVERMIARLRHRGPDHQAVMDLGGACFGHARLTILDLSPLGHQPMLDETGRFAITFNGEIYNQRDLRRELERHVRFRSTSDTEVALYAIAQWGPAAFDRFDGMFAIAFWDRQKREVILGRDRFGEKPLHYTTLSGQLSFASEIDALLADPEIERALHVSIPALNDYLALGYVLHPRTLYREIAALPPAHYLRYSDGAVRELSRYWDYRRSFERRRRVDAATAAEELSTLLSEAVRTRLQSDVPVGAFLSGGLDSSAVAALARRHLAYDLHTFTVRFHESTYDESPDARLVAERLGTRHHESPVAGPPRRMIDEAIDCYDQPFSDTSLVPMVAVARVAAEHVKVVLSGDGADEIFCGYPTYLADRLRGYLERVPTPALRLVGAALARLPNGNGRKTSLAFRLAQFGKGVAATPQFAHYAWRELHDESERIALLGEEHAEEIRAEHPFFTFQRCYAEAEGLDPLSQHLYVDAKTWLVDDILVKVDRATMAVSLEARAPFLARDLAEYAASLPPGLKLRGARGKYVLRRAAASIVPRETLRKAKAGFNAPINVWLGNRAENEFRFFNKYVARRHGLRLDGGPIDGHSLRGRGAVRSPQTISRGSVMR